MFLLAVCVWLAGCVSKAQQRKLKRIHAEQGWGLPGCPGWSAVAKASLPAMRQPCWYAFGSLRMGSSAMPAGGGRILARPVQEPVALQRGSLLKSPASSWHDT